MIFADSIPGFPAKSQDLDFSDVSFRIGFVLQGLPRGAPGCQDYKRPVSVTRAMVSRWRPDGFRYWRVKYCFYEIKNRIQGFRQGLAETLLHAW